MIICYSPFLFFNCLFFFNSPHEEIQGAVAAGRAKRMGKEDAGWQRVKRSNNYSSKIP
jgi:hypothetical protein